MSLNICNDAMPIRVVKEGKRAEIITIKQFSQHKAMKLLGIDINSVTWNEHFAQLEVFMKNKYRN